jgi:hypothetical protein
MPPRPRRCKTKTGGDAIPCAISSSTTTTTTTTTTNSSSGAAFWRLPPTYPQQQEQPLQQSQPQVPNNASKQKKLPSVIPPATSTTITTVTTTRNNSGMTIDSSIVHIPNAPLRDRSDRRTKQDTHTISSLVKVEDGSASSQSLSGACLHCQQVVSSDRVQKRCWECQAYICQGCHWCREYQANHEIRVCDRCEAHYCRACDEMDHCDDCGEVVCASCSTLLSCKFCGGGLCEECATACGRYVVVLHLCDYFIHCIAVEFSLYIYFSSCAFSAVALSCAGRTPNLP